MSRRKNVILGALTLASGLLVTPVASAENQSPTGAPVNTEVAQATGVLAQTLEPNLGYFAKPAAQAGVVDDLNHADLGLNLPRAP
jgi:hypothetical protein